MLFLVLFFFFAPGDWFLGGGGSWGTGFTDTEVSRSVVLGVQFFPLSYQKLGFFYDFQFSYPDSIIRKPFKVERSKEMHSIGPMFRFSVKKIQPWVSGGILCYYETTKIKLFSDYVAESKEKKTAPLLAAGNKLLILRNLYWDIGAGIAGTARPPWQFFTRVQYRF